MKKKLTKNQYYLLSFSWGFIITFIGYIIALGLIMIGKRPKQNQYGWYFEIGEKWGGCNLGCITLVSKNPSQHTLNHEFGHSIQNCYFGPFMIIIAIASVIRYHYRNYLIKVKHLTYYDLPAYDDIWFEGQASAIGDYYKEL